jgi:2-dehydro-3-deoxyphosphogalactonate aldolase
MLQLDAQFDRLPLISILRGVRANQILSIAEGLYAAGMRIIEIPLNSPDALLSLELLAQTFSNELICGAGTVLSPQQVKDVQNAGGKIIVSPNCNVQVISATISRNLISLPGIASPSEAFSAIAAGASRLKLFPALSYGTSHLVALKSVLPSEVKMYPVGGVDETNLMSWINAGADGAGFGSSLYQADDCVDDVKSRALVLQQCWRDRHAS